MYSFLEHVQLFLWLSSGFYRSCFWFSSEVAEHPERIKSCFRRESIGEKGLFPVRLYDTRSHQWADTTIDDLLPVGPTGRPLALPSDSELWVALIVKALVKIHGSYGTLLHSTQPYPEIRVWQMLVGEISCAVLEKVEGTNEWKHFSVSEETLAEEFLATFFLIFILTIG